MFPGLVSVREDIGAIIVMEKIKVTDKGVTDGTGLAADKVRAIFDDYMEREKPKGAVAIAAPSRHNARVVVSRRGPVLELPSR